MIVSHKHRFIYIKTVKTASSAMETALAQLCGPEDIVTPTREDLMEGRPGRIAQNWKLDHPAVPKRPLVKRLLRRPVPFYDPSNGYYEHMPAWRVRTYVGPEVWQSYFKFSFERNPWDRQVSYYFYKTRNRPERPSFEGFIRKRGKRAKVKNWGLYTIDGEIALDFIGKFENLQADFDAALARIGVEPIPLAKVNSSGGESRSYREFYNDWTRSWVAEAYRPEIEAFGYTF